MGRGGLRSSLDAPLARLAVFAAGVALLAGLAAIAGRASGIEVDAGADEGMGHTASDDVGPAGVGLSDSASGVRLTLTPTTLVAGAPTRLALVLTDEDGTPVTDLDEAHDEPPLHLILVRRDLTGYRHLHPTRRGDGFAVSVTLPEAGAWRAYADFERNGEKTVLGRDLIVPGDFEPRPLPAPTSAATVEGYAVELTTRDLRAGAEARVEFAIARGGQPVTPEPYLGAAGHLVAIREDDLAYLHVHPLEGSRDGTIAFDAELAEPGRYALFLQFRDEGRVRTVTFTIEVQG